MLSRSRLVLIALLAGCSDPASGPEIVVPAPCDDPQPILQQYGDAAPSGLVTCSNGQVHRVEAVACEPLTPSGSCQPNPTPASTCATDDDCDPGSVCDQVEGGAFGNECECTAPACTTDADCPNGKICACAGVHGVTTTCIDADCTADADCPDGLCRLDPGSSCRPFPSLACTSPNDTCALNDDCDKDKGEVCAATPDGWSCVMGNGCL